MVLEHDPTRTNSVISSSSVQYGQLCLPKFRPVDDCRKAKMAKVREMVGGVRGHQGLVEEERQLEGQAVTTTLNVLDCHIKEVGVGWRKELACGHGVSGK
jgi:hypothetical protein